MLSEVFWIAFVSTASGMIIKLASMAYKTKCKECSFCCIKVIRDVELEEKENEFEITHNLSSSKNKLNEVTEEKEVNEEKE
jgi:hypothetical protein